MLKQELKQHKQDIFEQSEKDKKKDLKELRREFKDQLQDKQTEIEKLKEQLLSKKVEQSQERGSLEQVIKEEEAKYEKRLALVKQINQE